MCSPHFVRAMEWRCEAVRIPSLTICCPERTSSFRPRCATMWQGGFGPASRSVWPWPMLAFSMMPNILVGVVDGSSLFKRWYYEAEVEHVESSGPQMPYLRVGWANTVGFKVIDRSHSKLTVPNIRFFSPFRAPAMVGDAEASATIFTRTVSMG